MIPEGRTEMESLLKKYTDSNYSERWSPYSVYQYETEFQNGAYEGLSKEVRKNISYSLQYLEYIQLQFDELKLNSIIKQELWKNYIIISMSIIESIFHHLVVKGGYRKTNKWENSKPIHSNVFEEDGKKKKYIITTATELDTPREEMMDFEFLINKVKEKKLISLTGKAYPYTTTTGQQKTDINQYEIDRNDSFDNVKTRTQTLRHAHVSQIRYDLVGKIAEGTVLTRNTVLEIIKGLMFSMKW